MPINNDKVIKVKCTELSYEGYGIAFYYDIKIFVAGLLPEEEAIIEVQKKTKNYWYASVKELINKNICRSEYQAFGSADLIHYDYEKQLEFKLNYFKKLFKWNLKSNYEIENLIINQSPKQFHYRNKSSVYTQTINGKLEYGYRQIHSHHFVIQKTDEMYLYDEKIISFLEQLQININSNFDQSIFNNLIQVVIRISNQNQLQVVFVFNSELKFNLKELLNYIQNINQEIVGVFYYIKKSEKSFKHWYQKIYGSEKMLVNFNNLKFQINIASFMQVNYDVANLIYQMINDYLSQNKFNQILDLYSGAGTITLNASKNTNKIIGIEVIYEAIEDAKLNARLNKINNSDFIHTNASSKKSKELLNQSDLVIVDPPRAGLDSSLINVINESDIKHMIYVSCDPKTLIRDLKLLEDKFEIKHIELFDMFPNTHHFESLVILERKNKKDRNLNAIKK